MRHLPIDEARLLPRFRDRVQLEWQQADTSRGEPQRAVREGVNVPAPKWKCRSATTSNGFAACHRWPRVCAACSLEPIHSPRCWRPSVAVAPEFANAKK
jgi:hypothetical protein